MRTRRTRCWSVNECHFHNDPSIHRYIMRSPYSCCYSSPSPTPVPDCRVNCKDNLRAHLFRHLFFFLLRIMTPATTATTTRNQGTRWLPSRRRLSSVYTQGVPDMGWGIQVTKSRYAEWVGVGVCLRGNEMHMIGHWGSDWGITGTSSASERGGSDSEEEKRKTSH